MKKLVSFAATAAAAAVATFTLAATCTIALTAQNARPLSDQRTYPSTSPGDSLASALAQRQALERKHVADDSGSPFVAPAPAPAAVWTPLGPLGIVSGSGSGTSAALSGRVTGIVTSQKNPNRMYLAAAGGGVWRSEDAGTSWSPASDTMLSMASGTLVLDERVGTLGALYYGTGDFTGTTYGVGILRSLDGGATWQQLSNQFENPLNSQTLRIALNPADPQTILAARFSGVWKTTDGGNTWNQTLKGLATDVVTDGNDPQLVFAALGNEYGDAANGVYRSLDGGSTWTLLNGSLPFGLNAGRISLAKTASDSRVVMALVASPADFSLVGLYRSDDFGGTWRQVFITPQLFFSQNYNYNRGWFAQTLLIDPASANNIFVGGEQLWRSTDGGQSFTNISQDSARRQLIHEGIFGVALAPGNPTGFYAATEGGIYQTINSAQTWFNLNRSLPIAQVNAVAVQPGAGAFLAAAESSGIIGLTGDQSVWNQYQPLNSGVAFFDPNVSNPTVYGGQSQLRPMRSPDGGATWGATLSGLNVTDPVAYYPPYIADPNQGNVLFGTSRVWRLTSPSASWTAISPQLATGGNYLTALAVASTGRIYTATSDGRFFYSVDGATNWTAGTIATTAKQLSVSITSIAVDPKNPLRAFATMTGFVTGHVFRTVDGGVNWQDLTTSPALATSNLPNASANAVVVDPAGPIYVATDVGVFRNEDGNSPWTSYNQGLPNTIVTSLAVDPTTNLLVAGTFGRGVYGIALRPPAANVPAFQALGIVDAVNGSTVLSPGAIATIFGTNLAGSGKVILTVNGVSAPLLFVSATQINFQVPFETTTASANILLTTTAGSTAATVEVSPASPGIFTNQPVSHASTGAPVTAANPAVAGEVISIIAGGLGDTTPGSVTGAPAPAQPLPLRATVLASVNSVAATVVGTGMIPGQTGVYFVNVTVPAGASGANVPVVIGVNGRNSNAVTIVVR